MTLELRKVTKSVGGNVHIHETNLTLEEGTFNVLLGTTLSGKTTLMQLMAGLDKPSSGEIWFRGKNVTGVAVQKRNVSMVYQQFINYPHLTVYENIASPLRVIGVDNAKIKERVGKVAELLRLVPMLQRKPAELSGGQQQRTAIARALVKDSDIILLDEPLANLDYKLREELRDELPRLFHDRHCIVAYATTEPVEALLFGGNTATLHEGRVTQFGPTAVDLSPADRSLERAGLFRPADQHRAGHQGQRPHPARRRHQLADAGLGGECAGWPVHASDPRAPHHADAAEWRHGDGRRPRAGGGAERLGKRAAFRPRRRAPGSRSRTACIPTRSERPPSSMSMSAARSCSGRMAGWLEGAPDGQDHAR